MLLREPARGWLDTRVHEKVIVGVKKLYKGRITYRRTMSRCFLVQIKIGQTPVKLVFFRFGRGLTDRMTVGSTVYVEGVAKYGMDHCLEMAQPKVFDFAELPPPVFEPNYSEGADRRKIEQLVSGVISGRLHFGIPQSFLDQEGIMHPVDLIRRLHVDGYTPEEEMEIEVAAACIEAFMLAENLVKASSMKREPLGAVDMDSAIRHAEQTTGFVLTGDQRKALQAIQKVLDGRSMTGAALVGDVGCGKSLVAAIAAKAVLDAGYAVLLMEPNSILANQIADTFRRVGLEPEIITGDNRNVPSAPCTIGTHALIHRNYAGDREVGLVIVDETQKFGTRQFQSLFLKHKKARLLQMTATPLPRSMMRSRLGGIVMIRMKETPKPRNVRTIVVSDPKVLKSIVIKSLSKPGNKIFIVHPSIGSHIMESVHKTCRNLQAIREAGLIPADTDILALNGEMSDEEKDRIIRRFKENECSTALVSTSIVEIGIDCESANMVIVRDAKRHGLSQLHQIRGRVGRHGKPGYCVLFVDRDAKPEVHERLNFLANTNDGFLIADYDMKVRGYGDLIGVAQKGKVMRLDLSDALHYHLFHAAMDWLEMQAGFPDCG